MKTNGLALAVDLGASGGKLFVGELKDGKAEIYPVHKFKNKIVLRSRSIRGVMTTHFFPSMER